MKGKLFDGLGEWMKELPSKIVGKTVDKTTEVAETVAIETIHLIGEGIVGLEGILIIVAIIGVFLLMFGERKWGTRLTSISTLLYLMGRLLLSC